MVGVENGKPAGIGYYSDGKKHFEEWYLKDERKNPFGPLYIEYCPKGEVVKTYG